MVNSLISGLKQSEITEGYSSSIASTTMVNFISLSEGVLLVDFSEELENNSGGSCRAQALISQIDSTLKQFEEVKEVRISVVGLEADILQP